MSMLKHDLNGLESKPAEGLSGRIYALDEKNSRAIKTSDMKGRQTTWDEIAKAGSKFPQFAGTEVGKLQKAIPEFHALGGRAIAKNVANEYGHFADAIEAKAKGNYREFTLKDGSVERGIVSGEGQDLKREGLWISKDQENRVRETGTFKEGKPNGAFRTYRQDGSLESSAYFKDGIQSGVAYNYNEKSEPVLKTEYENGVAKEPVTIDPVAAKKAAEERKASWKAQNSFTMAR